MRRENEARWVAAALIAACAAVYARSAGFDFVELDDAMYLQLNPVVRKGLTAEGIRWAFTSFWVANWHPLTWISHMLDVSLFGMDAGGHHLVNVGFHLANTLLLFHVLRRMTGSIRRSGLAAALFCLHPLHVESVLWIAERKDVLSGFFFFLALLSHLRQAERPGVPRSLATAAFAALALLSKPMAVTLPFVLLLLDFWPLGRMEPALAADPARRALPPVPFRRLVLEKAPLFLLSAASCVVTWVAQAEWGATRVVPPLVRAANAVVAYAAYLGKTAWPAGLAVLYPHPMDSIPGWKVAGASLFLAAATGAILLRARRIPWLAAGWLWYLGMLVPVIGVVQVGNQAMADRYTYLPLVGIFVAFAWGGAALAASLRIPPRASGLLAVALLAALAGRSWDQGRHWRDSTTLFLHALEVTGDSWVDRGIQGEKALDAGRYDEAVGHYRSLIRIEPFGIETRNNLGVALLRSGRVDEAVEVLEEAARMDPGVAGVRLNLGLALERKGRADEAAAQFREALRLDPGNRAAISRLRALGRDPGGRRPAIPGANPPSRW